MTRISRGVRRRRGGDRVRSVRTRLFGEGSRTGIAAVVGAVLAIAITVPVPVPPPADEVSPVDDLVVSAVVLSLCLYQLLYVAISLVVFLRASRAELEAFATAGSRSGRVRRALLSGEPGVSLAVSSGFIAMVTAVWVLPQVDDIVTDVLAFLTTTAGIGLIVGAWASMVVTYAIDYTRKHLAGDGLTFPGEAPNGFSDYLYFSIAVSTAFATSDVQVTSTALRRTVAGHAVVAFAFNVVIVALTIAVIVS